MAGARSVSFRRDYQGLKAASSASAEWGTLKSATSASLERERKLELEIERVQ